MARVEVRVADLLVLIPREVSFRVPPATKDQKCSSNTHPCSVNDVAEAHDHSLQVERVVVGCCCGVNVSIDAKIVVVVVYANMDD